MKTAQAAELVPLAVEVRGEIVSSNLAEFHAQVSAALAAINYSPATDEEFSKAEDLVKGLKAIEESVALARQRALEGSADLAATLREMEAVGEELAAARCKLAKRVKEQKDSVKEERIATALLRIPHPKRGTFRPMLLDAIKGKSSLASIDASLAKTVQEITLGIEKCREILDEFEEDYGADLIMDRSELELRSPEHLPEALANRVEQKRLRDEAAKAKAEADRLKAQAAPPPPQAPPPPTSTLPAVAPAPPAAAAPEGRSPSEEWAAYRLAVSVCADQLKAERAVLTHEVNQRRASEFVRLLNEAWRAVQKIN